MDWKKIKTYIWPIAFWTVAVCFFGTVIVCNYTVSRLQEKNSISIRIFNRIVYLPNTFILDHVSVDEVGFVENKKRVVIGKKVRDKPKFFDYLREHQTSESQKCGVNILRAELVDPKSVLFYDDSDFIWFIGMKDKFIDDWISIVCQSTVNRIKTD